MGYSTPLLERKNTKHRLFEACCGGTAPFFCMMAAFQRGGRWVELSAALCVGTELPQGPDLSAVAAFFARSELYAFSSNVCTQPSVKGRLCGSLPHGTLPYVRGRVLFTLRAHVQQ